MYKLIIYLYILTLSISLILFFRYIYVKKNTLDLPTKTLYREQINTGDIFLLDWQRANNIFISSIFNNSFMHPSIAVWEKGDLFMIELINYFNDEKYKGLIKVPFNKWYRINRRALFLHNKLETDINREKIAQKILKFYIDYKGKMGQPKGFGRDWLRFWKPEKNYKEREDFSNLICTELIAMLLKEVGIAKKNKSIESYQPDSFIGMKDFELEKGYKYDDYYLAKIDEN